ncbi:copii coat [Pyrrhoderma noxium]|uniref:Copii coat n=1 Tax=Pyrrhoderma noxium TaxID=2282107 RepID=A0A286U5D8_9AGAM|nr:copii coat [Pyrrhoderma noxium]
MKLNQSGGNLEDIEEYNDVPRSWFVWPSSRIEPTKTVVPISVLYPTLKERDGFPPVEDEPVPSFFNVDPLTHTRLDSYLCWVIYFRTGKVSDR